MVDGKLVKDADRITEHDRERAKAAGVQAMHARMQQTVLLAATDEEAYTMIAGNTAEPGTDPRWWQEQQ